MNRRTLVLALLFLVGCKRCDRERQVPTAVAAPPGVSGEVTMDGGVPRGDARTPGFSFTFAVYHFAAAPPAGLAELRKVFAAAGIAVSTTALDAPPKVPTAEILTPPLKDFAPPTLDTLRFRGKTLSEREKTALQTVSGVTVVVVSGPAVNAAASYRVALRAGLALQAAAPGILFDDDTRQAISQAAWTARLDDWAGDTPRVPQHITIDAYQDNELLRMVTLGMRKFALPDVSVNQVAKSDADGMSALVNLTCQTLAEHPELPRVGELDVRIATLANVAERKHIEEHSMRGGSGAGVMHLVKAEPHEGDARNRLMDLVFPGPIGTLQERQIRTIGEILGMKDDTVGVKHDAELLEASKRARAKALLLKPRFAKGPPDLDQLLVKGPFKTATGDNEWMWIEVTRWSGTRIDGILQNEPIGDMALKAGARVSVEEGSIFDYIYRHGDGGVEGNETSKILEKKGVPR